jgi:hypothetical protein
VKKFALHPRWFLLLALAGLALALTGCATTDSENASARPWNSPQGWETGGLPSSMFEGR